MSEDDDTTSNGPLLWSLYLTGWEDVIFELEDEPEESPWAPE